MALEWSDTKSDIAQPPYDFTSSAYGTERRRPRTRRLLLHDARPRQRVSIPEHGLHEDHRATSILCSTDRRQTWHGSNGVAPGISIRMVCFVDRDFFSSALPNSPFDRIRIAPLPTTEDKIASLPPCRTVINHCSYRSSDLKPARLVMFDATPEGHRNQVRDGEISLLADRRSAKVSATFTGPGEQLELCRNISHTQQPPRQDLEPSHQ